MATDDPSSVSARNSHAGCLLCGDLNPSSLGLRFRAGSEGTVWSEFEARRGLQGYDGMLHGGVIGALLDSAMTHCLFHRGIQALTADMRIRYVRPACCGEVLEIRAKILSCRPPLYKLRAELSGGDGVIAWAEAKFLRRRESRRPSAHPEKAADSSERKGSWDD